ncbi:baseplate J/gp47 family protein [Peptoniphilus sp. GNH]|nr:baseplate J/gp47 family protein [Peptoniphilus sp. GNH]
MDNCKDGLCMIDDVKKINNSEFGLTKFGFRRKLYPECVADRIKRAKKVFGVNIDTSETSFLGKLIRNLSWDEAYLWELAEDVYNAPFVNSAEGTALDNVGMYLTITRRPATKSKTIITIYGDDGVIIPKGFMVSTKKGIVFETLEEASISGGSADVYVESIGAGRNNNVDKETITEILNPSLGINKVINKEASVGGLNIETDAEFRERYKKSYSRVGGSTVPAITAALLDIDKVVDCEVRENVTMETIDGIPPKSVACFVYGGEDRDIAKTIYDNKAAGIQAFGDVVIDIKDEKESIHHIGFTRAKVENIFVKLRIKKDKDYTGDDSVKRAVVNYIGGKDEDGIEYSGLKLGEDVIQSKVLGRIMCLGGVADIDAFISKNGKDWQQTNIEIARASIAKTSPEKVVIEYVS